MRRRYSGRHRHGVPFVPIQPVIRVRVDAERFIREMSKARDDLIRFQRSTGRPLGLD